MQRRLAETPWGDTPHGTSDICQADGEQGVDHSAAGEAEEGSANGQPSGTAGGTGKGGTSRPMHPRGKPVQEVAEDEAGHENTMETHEDDVAVREVKRVTGAKRKALAVEEASTDPESEENPPQDKGDHRRESGGSDIDVEGASYHPFAELSEVELQALLMDPGLVPTLENLGVFYKFYEIFFNQLRTDATAWLRRATQRERALTSVNTLLRKLAVAVLACNQFRVIRALLPPCPDKKIEENALEAQLRLEREVRGELTLLFGEDIVPYIQDLKLELLRTAVAASLGFTVTPRVGLRRAPVPELQPGNPFTDRLTEQSIAVSLRVSGRRPLTDIGTMLERRPDINRRIPESSFLRQALAAEAAAAAYGLKHPQAQLPPGGGATAAPSLALDGFNSLSPLLTDVIPPEEVPADAWTTALSAIVEGKAIVVKQWRYYARHASRPQALDSLLRAMTSATQVLADVAAVCQTYPHIAGAKPLQRATRQLKRALSTTWDQLKENPRNAEIIEQILSTSFSSISRPVRQQAAAAAGSDADPEQRLKSVVEAASRPLRRFDPLKTLVVAIAADPGLIQHGQKDAKGAPDTTDHTTVAQRSAKQLATPKGQPLEGRHKRSHPVQEEDEDEFEQPEYAGTDDGGFSTGGASGLESAFASDGDPGHAAEIASVPGSTGSEHKRLSLLLDVSAWGEQGAGKKGGEGPQGYSDDTANADAPVAGHAAVSGLSSGSLVLYPETELGPPPPKKARTATHKQEGGKGTPASPSHGEHDIPMGAEEATADAENDLGFPEDWLLQALLDLEGDDGGAPLDVWAEPQTGLPYAPLPEANLILDNLVSLLDAQEDEDGMAEGDEDSHGAAE
ncbi:hypothetical protein NCLIV_044470 [Neospora caninum Liverpool]|uniref:Uncharacterized protein n=1 Tax=Neospora caninum (strain Liverpool) TaxID=572307 RepID=F0VB09_NEOCL|nr:hypothetical protein NCLIV_044470 [Neospora caninum Liverpool]CBZ51385.1 hypothetical protein NCLIV_044470 [Neospora caninum Liverpool]|eukprot:XP_003881418.1 hypothetical protein NCLIV_044470 [Neospora caninum Liverpool]